MTHILKIHVEKRPTDMKLCYNYKGHVSADSRQRVALQYDVITVTKNAVHFEQKYHKPRIWTEFSARCNQYLSENRKAGTE
jgi:hypothetical protein